MKLDVEIEIRVYHLHIYMNPFFLEVRNTQKRIKADIKKRTIEKIFVFMSGEFCFTKF